MKSIIFFNFAWEKDTAAAAKGAFSYGINHIATQRTDIEFDLLLGSEDRVDGIGAGQEFVDGYVKFLAGGLIRRMDA